MWWTNPPRLLGFVLLLLSLTSCGPFDKEPAERVARLYYEAVKAENFEAALEYFSPKFFEKTPREEFLANLARVRARLGELRSYELTGARTNTAPAKPDSDIGYRFIYKVTYADYSATETLDLTKPSGSDLVQIIGLNITSDGLN
jgi:hypothetical protein